MTTAQDAALLNRIAQLEERIARAESRLASLETNRTPTTSNKIWDNLDLEGAVNKFWGKNDGRN